jgi:hypothetical protein
MGNEALVEIEGSIRRLSIAKTQSAAKDVAVPLLARER